MRRRRKKSLPQEPVTLDIESLNHEGRGIAHLDGKVIFVAESLAGEQVEAQYTDRRSKFDEAKCVNLLKKSPDRIEPACEYSSVCGGCSLQHFHPKAQLSFKEETLFEKLQHSIPDGSIDRIRALEGPVSGYRRKARLAVRYVHKKGQVLVGFREKGNSFITNMDSCYVLDPRVSNLIPKLKSMLLSLDGFRNIPQIEVAVGDEIVNSESVALIFRHLLPLSTNDQEILVSFASQNNFTLYLQPGGTDSVHKVYPDGGNDQKNMRLYYELPEFNLNMAFHPMDFTQVNAAINQKMISQALALLKLDKNDKVLDLFCGLGNFTLPAATQCQRIVGVEGAQMMVERAYENASRNKIENCSFYCADLTQSIRDSSWFDSDFNKVILDPPRSGAWEILPDLVSSNTRHILYVSCNPSTLARDAGFLVENGFTLLKAGVMDMFPHTTHVESMAVFSR